MQARFLCSVLLLALCAAPAFAADPSGVWTGSIADPRGGDHELTLNLKVDGDSVTGTFSGGPPMGETQSLVNGRLSGDRLSFELELKGPRGENILARCEAKLTESQLRGTHKTPMGTLAWEARKQ